MTPPAIIEYQRKLFEDSATANLTRLKDWFPFDRYQFVAFNPKNSETQQGKCSTMHRANNLARKGWVVYLNDRRKKADK